MTPELTLSNTTPTNFFSRTIGVLFSPGETFPNIGQFPKILIPMIALAIIIGSVGYVSIHRVGIESIMRKQMQTMIDRGWLPQEKADEAIANAVKSPEKAKIQGFFNGAIFYLILTLIVAGIFKLMTMLMGKENTFKAVLSVTLYTFVAVGLVSSLLAIIVLYLKSPEDIEINNVIGSNLGAMLELITGKDAMPKFVKAFCSFIDLFAIWKIALLGIGYAAITPKLKTSTAITWLSVAYLIMALILSPLAAMFG